MSRLGTLCVHKISQNHKKSSSFRFNNKKVPKAGFNTKFREKLLKTKESWIRRKNYSPTVPSKTRWGTFLSATFYHIENFEKISEFVLTLPSSSEKIVIAKNLLTKNDLKSALLKLKPFKNLIDALEKFQSETISLDGQLEIMEN